MGKAIIEARALMIPSKDKRSYLSSNCWLLSGKVKPRIVRASVLLFPKRTQNRDFCMKPENIETWKLTQDITLSKLKKKHLWVIAGPHEPVFANLEAAQCSITKTKLEASATLMVIQSCPRAGKNI